MKIGLFIFSSRLILFMAFSRIIAGTIYQLQIGSAKYGAIYGSFAAR
ncbi:MAG: hypothetical protein ABH952_11145 [Candidatus Omnitrophota bacterium]